MKQLIAAVSALLIATPAVAGNLDTFVAPEEPMVEEAPMGGSNAAWIVPLLAIALIAVAASSDDDDDEPMVEEIPD